MILLVETYISYILKVAKMMVSNMLVTMVISWVKTIISKPL